MSSKLPLSELYEGMKLPGLKKHITQEGINLYAKASKDFNPIHVDEAFARKTPLGGTIAHGMLNLAFISQMMAEAFGIDWLVAGKLSVRFKNPACPGDTVTVSGKITRLERGPECTAVTCDVLCANQKGEAVITGEASIKIVC